MSVKAAIGSQRITVVWDVSTGDPIVPPPEPLRVPRLLGEAIEMLGYPPEMVVAEKGVTILERVSPVRVGATTSTSCDWRRAPAWTTAGSAGRPKQSPTTAACRSARSPPAWSVTARWGRRSGRPGDASRVSSTSANPSQLARVAEVLDPVFGG
ncbi:hypothetical protein GCM10010123_16290 [Pilimelia anulata]|uniref:Uncharacterized protein n=1 Tax=Pilimelia anulata TaxID=53371 RepID=A0A8J3B1Y9_9ACTN|nr:hypothetical protein GCM10010123_16290 [Pilimelia anulata]